MKDEIKEILDYLKNNTFIPDETKRKYKILHRDEVNNLLDYITNLQEENERLKDYFNIMVLGQNNMSKRYWDLQQRIDKAIEYIKQVNKYGVLEDTYAKDLLEILGDKE